RNMLPHPWRQLKSGRRPALRARSAAAVLPAGVIEIGIGHAVHGDAEAAWSGGAFFPDNVRERLLSRVRIDPEFQRIITGKIEDARLRPSDDAADPVETE